MGSGLLLGFLVGLVFLAIGVFVREEMYSTVAEVMITIVTYLFVCLSIFGGGYIGYCVEYNENQAFIEQYEISKYTIETSIENDKLSGFERMSLIETAIELNAKLVSKQHRAKMWYEFCIPYEITKLEPISFD